MKKLICVLMCILLCGCALNEQSDAVVSGDVVDNENIIVEDIEEKSYSFEQVEMPDGIKLYYCGADGLYYDEETDEDGIMIMYLHRKGSLEKLDRLQYGSVDEYGGSTVSKHFYHTDDGEPVWFFGMIGEYNGGYVFNSEFVSSIYLLDENGSKDIVPDNAFGFTREEFLDATNGNVFWGVAASGNNLKGSMLAYESDKYVENGEILIKNGLWILNLDTKEEYRINFANEPKEYVGVVCWLNEDTLIFKKDNELYIHNPSRGTGYEPFYTIDSEMYTFSVEGTHLWLFEKNGFGVKVIELDSMTEHYFDLSVEISVQDVYDETKYLATSEDQNAVVIIDLETNTFEMFEWNKDTYIEYAYFDESGDIIVIEEPDTLQGATSILGIYKLTR